MKRLLSYLLLVSISLIFFSSCEEKVDIEKEKEAIKTVFEQEKDAFFQQDLEGMADTWVKDQSSVKIYMNSNGQTKMLGWDKINEVSQQEISDTSWNRQLVKVDISNYQIDVMEDCAWVLCDYHWEGTLNESPLSMDQSRICVLKKANEVWKFVLMAMYTIPQKETE
jgi:hypothetical protein